MADFTHVGDIGTAITITFYEKDGVTPVDLTDVDTIEFKVERRDGSGMIWEPDIIDIPGGVARYVTLAGDLDIAGKWQIQGHIVFTDTTEWHTEKVTFEVKPILSGA
jgi:hypothetical protein